MACPLCDHTMQCLGDWFWCPRCGTVKSKKANADSEREHDIPMLVRRLRADYIQSTFTADLRECIYNPRERLDLFDLKKGRQRAKPWSKQKPPEEPAHGAGV